MRKEYKYNSIALGVWFSRNNDSAINKSVRIWQTVSGRYFFSNLTFRLFLTSSTLQIFRLQISAFNWNSISLFKVLSVLIQCNILLLLSGCPMETKKFSTVLTFLNIQFYIKFLEVIFQSPPVRTIIYNYSFLLLRCSIKA